MLELGPNSAKMHEEVGGFVARQGIDQLVACGPLGKILPRVRGRLGKIRLISWKYRMPKLQPTR